MLVDADYFRNLFDYSVWARDRLFAAAAGMTTEQYAAPNGFSYDGLKSLLPHVLSAQIAWLNRMRPGATPVEPVSEAESATLQSLVAKWTAVDAELGAFLANLRDEDLKQSIEYKMRDGSTGSATVWELLTIIYTHTVQHRSEAAEALTLVGRSPGNLDYVVYMRERA